MSGKAQSSRGKRSDKESSNHEGKQDGIKVKQDSKTVDSHARNRAHTSSSSLTDGIGRSPSHGRADRNHNTKENKPFLRGKDRDTASDRKRGDGDKTGSKSARGELSSQKHGDSITNQHGHGGHGHSRDVDRSSNGRETESKKQPGWYCVHVTF